jgi:hypothetical protein
MSTHGNAISVIITEIRGLCKKVGVDGGMRPGSMATYPNSLIITMLILKSLFGFDSERSLQEKYSSRLVVPDKKRQKRWNTKKDKELLKKRGIIETVNEQLQDHMKIHRTRANSHAWLLARVQSIILAFTFGCYHNSIRGRPLLALKSIVI